ncbi:MAG: hypothetical protein ABSA76_06280 [Bacteroidales bacterium]
MANVKARVELKARVCVINATSGPKEGKQWHNIHYCTTGTINLYEWLWRYHTAITVLCGGSAPYGTSYAGAIGYYWL